MDQDGLRKIDIFSSLPDDALGRVEQLAEEISIGEGKAVLRQDTAPDQMFVIEEGTVDVKRGDDVIASLGPGDVVGESGMLRHGLRNADVVATSDVEALFFTQDRVRALRRDIPDLDDKLKEVFEERAN